MALKNIAFFFVLLFVFSCGRKAQDKVVSKPPAPAVVQQKQKVIADAAGIMQRKQVPVLCYHRIRNWRRRDTRVAKECIIPFASFKKHIKMLADSGYHTILPDQLYNYLVKGDTLPAKPIIISFDDTNIDQYTRGAAELKKYNFKAVYFITAEVIGKGKHMKASQIRELADSGNAIANHTWTHPNLKKLRDSDWTIQLGKSNTKIEQITGKPVTSFAYPFGLYDENCINELHKFGFKMAFQLGAPRFKKDPLMALRRIIDDGHWTTKNLINSIKRDF